MFKFADCKGGFPHSEMFGSQGARASPNLIAACHVLHRLSTPRHPSEALMRLIVLSKTHAWGSVFAWPAVRRTGQAPTHALRYLSLQTMMSSRIHPQAPNPQEEAGRRIDPSIHDVRLPPPANSRGGNSFFRDRFSGTRVWWSQTGSNRRPHACKARALPTEL